MICEIENCKTSASFGYLHDRKRTRCSKHKEDRVSLNSKYCEYEECMNQAYYAIKEGDKPIRCIDHKDDYIKVSGCRAGDCIIKIPTYGLIGEKPLRCAKHKLINMVDVKNKTCAEDKCSTRPSYNYGDQDIGMYCKIHKKNNMVDVVSKKCAEDKCLTQPSYNYKDQINGMYCKIHKKDDMIDVIHKKCAEDKCSIHPSYSYKGQSRGMYCKIHKKDNMVDVINKKCIYQTCDKQASFGIDGIKLYCSNHSESKMILLSNKKCQHSGGCDIGASFNFKGKKAEFCKTHSTDGMIHIRGKYCSIELCDTMASFGYISDRIKISCKAHISEFKDPDTIIDLAHRICEICDKIANYGHHRQGPRFCRDHVELNCIRNPNRKCKIKKCREFAIFGLKTHQHCEEHKLDNEINIVEKQCIDCKLPNALDKDNKCIFCNKINFKKYIMAKQNKVKEFLDLKIKDGVLDDYVSSDKIIDKGICGRERPDFLFDFGSIFVILEVDEHQHISKSNYCEMTRMFNIGQSLGMKTIFIRYNPDSFKVDNKKQNVSDLNRHKKILDQINYFKNNPLIEVDEITHELYLFYDNYDESNIEIKPIKV